VFGRELADVIDFRDLADEPLVAQFIEGMEEPLRIPEIGRASCRERVYVLV
jgi:hypothetical protein